VTKTTRKLLLVFLGLLLVGCSVTAYSLYGMFYNVILESKDTMHFNVEELRGAHPTKLKITGFPLYSGMIVRSVTQKKHDSTIVVSAHLAVVGLSKPLFFGNVIDYDLTVPDSVNEVRFGSSKTLIWKRGVALTPLPEGR
jgi:hypothetical protein